MLGRFQLPLMIAVGRRHVEHVLSGAVDALLPMAQTLSGVSNPWKTAWTPASPSTVSSVNSRNKLARSLQPSHRIATGGILSHPLCFFAWNPSTSWGDLTFGEEFQPHVQNGNSRRNP